MGAPTTTDLGRGLESNSADNEHEKGEQTLAGKHYSYSLLCKILACCELIYYTRR